MEIKILAFCCLLFLFFSCTGKKEPFLFTKVSKKHSGIDFRNRIVESENFNIFQYPYFYNGAGLAVGDFNNDGLQDLCFTGNMVKNRLYINRGDLRFEDRTKQSGIAAQEGWCTGVTPVDINNDGWLDLYICRAGYPFEKLRKNLLFINNGDLTFTEKAAEYGIDDAAHSTQAAFFDFDKDGDLDLFLLNHSTPEYSKGSLEIFQLKNKTNPAFTNKLYRNDEGAYTDITATTGLHSNVLSFSLGLSISDLNEDGWPDIFVANDFNEPDYLFINNQDGTFSNRIENWMDHTSMFSMGVDIADLNGDGLLDLVSLDMLPEGNFLQKMHSGADNFDKINLMIEKGFFKQYSRNMLHLNNGDQTFSEIGQLAGVSNTDWSWSPLIFDFDNDGNRDLFISNGYLRDHTNMDFLKFTADEVIKIDRGEEHVSFEEYVAQMPSIIHPNYFYKNKGNLVFENVAKEWGLDEPVISQSAVYADLDNDGDLDLVFNNTEDYATILENHSDKNPEHHYLKIELKGSAKNSWGIGTKVKVYSAGKTYFQEQSPIRGFQSSVDPILHFGLGTKTSCDSILINWPNGTVQKILNPEIDQVLEIDIRQARQDEKTRPETLAEKLFTEIPNLISFKHQEDNFNDFKQQSLLPRFYSREGPCIAVSEKDALVFIGGAKGQSGQLFFQNPDHTFSNHPQEALLKHAASEDTDAVFFDADGDGDRDLLVSSGGYQGNENDPNLQNRLYLSDGHGQFSWAKDQLPSTAQNSICVRPADFDKDGDLDLFLGGMVQPGKYPMASPSQLLINDGKGNFSDASTAIATEINQAGLPQDAVWADLNKDTWPDLIVLGEWMPIQIFENQKGHLKKATQRYLDFPSEGLWTALHAADFDGDGDTDLIAGNWGKNSQWKVSAEEPLELYYDDFDQNGSVDPILCSYLDGQSYPFVSRDDLYGQLPMLQKKFVYFKEYANAGIQDLFSPEVVRQAKRLEAFTLESIYLENVDGQLRKKTLPPLAQVAPVHSIVSLDMNKDGHLDFILAGNTSKTRVKLGRLDGNHGQVYLGNGQGDFTLLPDEKEGLLLRGDVRALQIMKVNNRLQLIVGTNDAAIKVYQTPK